MSVVLGGRSSAMHRVAPPAFGSSDPTSASTGSEDGPIELEQELTEAKTGRSAMAALLEAKADEIEKNHRTLQEMDGRNRVISQSFEQADREVHSLRGECKKLADLLERRDSEIEDLREAKAHSGEVSEKLARDLAARDQQLAHAMENLAAQKTTFDKATRDVEILRKLNEQKDMKIAALTKEKSRLIERLTQLRATTAAKKARTQREGRAEREAVRDPGVLNAVKTAARRASAPVKVDRCGEGDDLGELRRTLAEANRELGQLRRALVLERQAHEATRRRGNEKSVEDRITPQALNPWKIHVSRLRE
ncbi:hypothetical protein FOZ61_009966 [Perkinsus olseni]|uniref:Uncharacterized protein n=1 Tax=Perkinsus olseni TaxID=32597 RepID=A0A7J6MN58_PEROL|nr:hypothetical protein FOZ61_009966 [Perkinsus olseni]KAF4672401.1 hypothetical protein FOL46_009029 [Perkinsus olseni]